MYLPLGPTLLRLVQLPLSLLDSDQPTLHSVVSDEQLKHPHHHHHHHHHGRKVVNNLGNLSPYHDARPFHKVLPDLPDDCSVDQVILLHRHGSRGPEERDDEFIHELVDTLEEAHDAIQAADLPPNLEFLKDGYEYDLHPGQLTAIGRKELFDHGVEFALRYPTFRTNVVVSTTVPRVKDSAHYFGQGLFGPEIDGVDFLTTESFPDPVPWLSPWGSCPRMAQVFPKALQTSELWVEEYIPSIVDRFNAHIPGAKFSANSIRGALHACPYDLAAHENSPWCDVFTRRELRGLEYELDLLLDGITGRGDDPGPLLGAFYIKKLIERLTDANGDAEPLYLEFAHDFSILLALSTMGLNKDGEPLSPTRMFRHRKFRSSHQTPFAASMVWEKFTCQKSFEGPQVRLLLNGATFPLSTCKKSKKDEKYGTCSLVEFVRVNEYTRSVEYQNTVWNATCEL